jgi:hypothetical protein
MQAVELRLPRNRAIPHIATIEDMRISPQLDKVGMEAATGAEPGTAGPTVTTIDEIALVFAPSDVVMVMVLVEYPPSGTDGSAPDRKLSVRSAA